MLQDDADDESVHAEDTSHNNADDSLEDELGLDRRCLKDGDTGPGGSEGSTQVCEEEGRNAAKAPKTNSLVRVAEHADCPVSIFRSSYDRSAHTQYSFSKNKLLIIKARIFIK